MRWKIFKCTKKEGDEEYWKKKKKVYREVWEVRARLYAFSSKKKKKKRVIASTFM